ncbi:MAG TPA: HAMP domain-containing protein, partial [Actinomycetota bacterium]|nr:HAMP domain-containing protein [Actinomycetota bacterium]
MNSLRVRLILGFALVALVPLAIAIVLLTDRIETMVRTQAADRVSTSLAAITTQLAEDERRTIEKVRILARDPELRRLYLVRPAGTRDLADFLEERRFLLGLDFLRVLDAGGVVRADASESVVPSDSVRRSVRPAPVRPGGRRGVSVRKLEDVQGLALVAAAPVEYQGARVGILEGGLALDEEFLERWRSRSGIGLALRDAGGEPVLGQIATAFPHYGPVIGRFRNVGTGGAMISEVVPLAIGDPPHAAIIGGIGTADSERTVTALQIASGILGLAALAIAITLGLLWSRQISRPVERLAAYSERLARGEWDEPLALHSVRELETLVDALDRMRRDLRSYRDRLVVSERQAAWSQMARKVAHEVKNPLTPIAISVADLKRSYEAGRPDFPQILDQAVRTIGEEVEALKRLLQEFSDFGRFPAPHVEPCRWSGLAADLETLYGREIREGRLSVSPDNRALVFPADAGQIRQALVNLIQNGMDASGTGGHVAVAAGREDSTAVLTVSDDGPGLT